MVGQEQVRREVGLESQAATNNMSVLELKHGGLEIGLYRWIQPCSRKHLYPGSDYNHPDLDKKVDFVLLCK